VPTKVCCTVCNNSCTGGSLTCDICLNVYDQQFSTLPADVFDILLPIVQSCGWVCVDCQSSCRDQIKQLHAAQAQMAEKLAEIELSLTAVSNDKNDNIHAKQHTPVHTPDGVHDVPLFVEKTMLDQQRRKKNIIVTGLPESQLTNDWDQFLVLCESHLTTKPLVGESDCWRLGTVDPARTTPRRLLVRLRSESAAFVLLSSARMLRQSSDNYVASNVYFNLDLSPAQAKLAYQLRVKRRENKARLRSDVKSSDLSGQSNTAANSARVVILARDSLYCSTCCSTNGSDLYQQSNGSTVNTTSLVVDVDVLPVLLIVLVFVVTVVLIIPLIVVFCPFSNIKPETAINVACVMFNARSLCNKLAISFITFFIYANSTFC